MLSAANFAGLYSNRLVLQFGRRRGTPFDPSNIFWSAITVCVPVIFQRYSLESRDLLPTRPNQSLTALLSTVLQRA